MNRSLPTRDCIHIRPIFGELLPEPLVVADILAACRFRLVPWQRTPGRRWAAGVSVKYRNSSSRLISGNPPQTLQFLVREHPRSHESQPPRRPTSSTVKPSSNQPRSQREHENPPPTTRYVISALNSADATGTPYEKASRCTGARQCCLPLLSWAFSTTRQHQRSRPRPRLRQPAYRSCSRTGHKVRLAS
jgi:hypothetical protein